jgi:hypothetical protein
MLKALLTFTLWLGCVAAHAADNRDSASYILPMCKEVLTDDGIKTWKGGMCVLAPSGRFLSSTRS